MILHVVFGPCWLVPPGALVGAYTDSARDGFFFFVWLSREFDFLRAGSTPSARFAPSASCRLARSRRRRTLCSACSTSTTTRRFRRTSWCGCGLALARVISVGFFFWQRIRGDVCRGMRRLSLRLRSCCVPLAVTDHSGDGLCSWSASVFLQRRADPVGCAV